MMRIATVLIVGALLASNAWARVGETSDEATERYGPPRDAHSGTYSNTITLNYNKDGVRVSGRPSTSSVD